MSNQHSTWITRHDVGSCNTATHHAEGGVCGTRYEARCACGFGQGAICHEQADAISRGHRANPNASVISWEPGPPLTAATITDQDLRALFARHCECRPLDLTRGQEDHAAIHDCDMGILSDVQYALGMPANPAGRGDECAPSFSTFVQAIREARGRCAEVINAARRGE